MSTGIAVSIGFAGAVVIAVGGHRTRALSRGGAVAAVVVGTAIFGLGGLRWAAVMIAFFVLSSLFSRVGRRKRSVDGFVEKGSRRDAVQVLANGGVAGILALIHGIDPGMGYLFPAFLGSMAAATADTWSTEIGSLSAKPPRSIVSWKTVPAGASGGITVLGLVGAVAGAIVIGLIGGVSNSPALAVVLAGSTAGFTGSVVDSLLGATVQRVNRCPTCMDLTERAIHVCGSATEQVQGVRFIDNDAVNVLTTLYGALCSGLLYLALT